MEIKKEKNLPDKLFLKNWLPGGWEEVSRTSGENQITITIGHIDPKLKADPVLTSGETVQMIDGEATTVRGIDNSNTMGGFFDAMTKMAATGFMKGYNPEKVQGIRNQFNKLSNEKYDTSSNISISRFNNEQTAKEMLDQQVSFSGFNGAIPGTNGMKMEDLVKIKEVRDQMTPQQLKEFPELVEKMKSIKMPTPPAGTRKFVGKSLGFPAAITEMENPEYKRFYAPKKIVKKTTGFVGGGFDPMAGKIPKAPPLAPPTKTLSFISAIRVGNYLVSGTLLQGVNMLSTGATFCQSLTQKKKITETDRVEGKTYQTKYIVPVASTLAAEGFVNKEEVEGMLKEIINRIDSTT